MNTIKVSVAERQRRGSTPRPVLQPGHCGAEGRVSVIRYRPQHLEMAKHEKQIKRSLLPVQMKSSPPGVFRTALCHLEERNMTTSPSHIDI